MSPNHTSKKEETLEALRFDQDFIIEKSAALIVFLGSNQHLSQ